MGGGGGGGGGGVAAEGLQPQRHERVGRADLALAAERYRGKLAPLARVVARAAMAECPICFEAFAPGRGSARARSVWPCGHAVCRECDRRMGGNGLHRCPTCRTPREGMNEQEAALAAQTAALAQRARDAAAANGGHPTGVQSVLTHAGRNYEVIFFASQASDARPTDVLEAFAEQVAPGPRTRTAARRRRAIADSVDFGEGPPAGLEAMDPVGPEDLAAEDGDEEPPPRRRRVERGFGPDESAGDFLSRGDEGISVLVRELLRPGTIDQFLAAREAVRR